MKIQVWEVIRDCDPQDFDTTGSYAFTTSNEDFLVFDRKKPSPELVKNLQQIVDEHKDDDYVSHYLCYYIDGFNRENPSNSNSDGSYILDDLNTESLNLKRVTIKIPKKEKKSSEINLREVI